MSRAHEAGPAQPVTGLRPGDVGEHVFLCGDPARVPRITAGWSNVREVVSVREYRIAVGERDGLRLAAASTGIGAPSTAILIEELAKVGARTLIRVGNSGGLDPSLGLGDLVITTGAVRDDGTSRSYVAPEYPAVASYEVVTALVDAARAAGVTAHVGLTWSLDGFYARNAIARADGGVDTMCFGGYRPPELQAKIEALRAARVRNCEMESGILLTLAGLFGLRSGCVCVVSDRTPWPGPAELDLDKNMAACIRVAVDAMLRLAKR
jgi:uridine phosphorylase